MQTENLGGMTAAQIKHMVSRFLAWRLPENFNPDGGISFKPTFNEHTAHPMKAEPVGTNLFTAAQAEAMVRHMLEGLPAPHEHAPAAGTQEAQTVNPRNNVSENGQHVSGTAEQNVAEGR